MTTWYKANMGNDHQGLVVDEETGRNVAVTYDIADAPLVAAAPELLAACDMVQRAHCGDGVDMARAVDACLLAISKAKGAS